MPIHCRRCWEQFEDKKEYDSHITAGRDEICDVISGQPPQGICPETEKLLKSRKKASKEETEEDRWIAMYRILFPDDLLIPSPCRYSNFNDVLQKSRPTAIPKSKDSH
jgi:hypothetical protein